MIVLFCQTCHGLYGTFDEAANHESPYQVGTVRPCPSSGYKLAYENTPKKERE